MKKSVTTNQESTQETPSTPASGGPDGHSMAQDERAVSYEPSQSPSNEQAGSTTVEPESRWEDEGGSPAGLLSALPAGDPPTSEAIEGLARQWHQIQADLGRWLDDEDMRVERQRTWHPGLRQLWAQVREEAESVERRMQRLGHESGRMALQAQERAGHATRERPFVALGVAAGVGALLGILLSRR